MPSFQARKQDFTARKLDQPSYHRRISLTVPYFQPSHPLLVIVTTAEDSLDAIWADFVPTTIDNLSPRLLDHAAPSLTNSTLLPVEETESPHVPH